MVIQKIMSEEIKNEEAIEEEEQDIPTKEEEPSVAEGEEMTTEQLAEISEDKDGEESAPEQNKREKRRANELEVIEEATVETELEMLVKMWNEYNDNLKKDKVIELYMQGIFILNRGAQQIGLELGNLQQKIKGQIQFMNYLAGKIKLAKQQYEQNTK